VALPGDHHQPAFPRTTPGAGLTARASVDGAGISFSDRGRGLRIVEALSAH
jgi:hypothetical protein